MESIHRHGPRSNPPRLAELLTVGELAQSLGVGERYVYRLVHERRVPFLKIGRYLRFDPAELDAWLDRARIAPVASTRDWS